MNLGGVCCFDVLLGMMNFGGGLSFVSFFVLFFVLLGRRMGVSTLTLSFRDLTSFATFI